MRTREWGPLVSVFIGLAVGGVVLSGIVVPALTDPVGYFAMVDTRVENLFGVKGASSWIFFVISGFCLLVGIRSWSRRGLK